MRVAACAIETTQAPEAIDLFCGLGGWTEGLLAHGYDVTGFDIEAHEYGDEKYPARLVLEDVMKIHGSRFKNAALIVASPPCQEFSYMAMPWSRAKQIARALRGEDEFPEGYTGSRTIAELTALFDACFRIKREASQAAGRDIPLVVENVRGAEQWVGRANWSFGSYYLWGDVPALMPRRDGRNKGFAGFKGFKDFHDCEAARKWSSKDPRRKQWSAEIAKIPFALSSWIAKTYLPSPQREARSQPGDHPECANPLKPAVRQKAFLGTRSFLSP